MRHYTNHLRINFTSGWTVSKADKYSCQEIPLKDFCSSSTLSDYQKYSLSTSQTFTLFLDFVFHDFKTRRTVLIDMSLNFNHIFTTVWG